MIPTRLGRDRQLGVAQSVGRPQPLAQHVVVETSHQLCRRAVGDGPEARDDAFRARIEEALCQPEQAFAADVAAEQAFRQLIATRFPGHAVLGEEHGAGRSALPAPYPPAYYALLLPFMPFLDAGARWPLVTHSSALLLTGLAAVAFVVAARAAGPAAGLWAATLHGFAPAGFLLVSQGNFANIFGQAAAGLLLLLLATLPDWRRPLAATTDRPVMLVLDDLPMAGERALRWLPGLVGKAAPARLLLVVLARDEATDGPDHGPDHGFDHGPAARIAEALAGVAPRVWSLPRVAPSPPDAVEDGFARPPAPGRRVR